MHGMIGKDQQAAVFKWDDEATEILRSMLVQGHHFSIIGEKLGTSKNACVGRARRMGFKSLHSPCSSERPPRAYVRKNAEGRSVVIEKAPRINPQARKPREIPPAPQAVNISLFDLSNRTCRFPTTKEDGAFLYCGAPEADLAGGKPYCPHHHHIAFHPAKPIMRKRTNTPSHPSRMAFGG